MGFLKVLLVLSPNDTDVGSQISSVCQECGAEVVITDGSEPIDNVPNLAIISDSIPGEPGMLMKTLSSSGIQTYLLTLESGLTVFNAVKNAGGKGIIPVQTALDDIRLLLNTLSGVNVFKQQNTSLQNTGQHQHVRTLSGQTQPIAEIARQTLTTNHTQAVAGWPVISQPLTAAEAMPNKQPTPAPQGVSPVTSYGINKQILISYAFKGGVGKSTLAANLAVTLASILNPKLSVCLVDFDINAAGRMADMLNVAPSTTILDWVATNYREDISRYLVDGPCGIKFLPAPRRAHDERAVTKEVAENVLQTLSRRFDIVIVDTPYVLRDSTIIAFDMATRIFLLTILDRPTLRGVYDLSQTIDALRIDPAKIQLVVNMVPKRSSLRIEDFQEAIKYPLLASIPYDPAVQTAVNRCELPVLDRKAKLFTSGLNKVVASIVPSYQYTAEQNKGKKRWFSFFKRR